MRAEKLPFNTGKGLSAHFGHLVEWEERQETDARLTANFYHREHREKLDTDFTKNKNNHGLHGLTRIFKPRRCKGTKKF
jgi:hypothetical protein